ncbi:HpaII family restriction endonuclease [Chakrabartyella piscis]|uniref:HpaII family restriction endonuclease n=1 Tax=Chakrabartyella piscis TaxID=2918914 RepID=UPI0029583746|nr:HpaII family restriction endonuclease [Chakrabartyella piscis]
MANNITGNKGEWSEMYVLLRLLSQGKIHAADENVEKIEDIFFPILKIMREELKTNKYEYIVNDDVAKIQIFLNDSFVKEFDKQTFEEQADYLYSQILQGANRAFPVAQTEEFMKEIGCTRLAAPSSDKTDITMQIHDIQTGFAPVCGFSIKSEVGNPPTLINATGATNFIYEVTGLTDKQIYGINAIETKSKIRDRMQRIFTEATSVDFVKVNSDSFARNMMLIDSRLTELVAHSLIYHYRDGFSTCKEVIEQMENDNPMNYPTEGFYEYKYKKLLCSAALGMTPAKKWDGIDEANGGYIIVTAKGDVLAYHIYNRAFFESYLLNQTRYERGSTSRHGFASLYKEDGKVYIKLNLQVRFR